MSPTYQSLHLARLKVLQEQSPNFPTAIRRISVQGQSHVYWTEQPFNKYAERDDWQTIDPHKVFTEVEVQQIFNEALLQSIKYRETWVLRYRPELSRLGRPATSSQD